MALWCTSDLRVRCPLGRGRLLCLFFAAWIKREQLGYDTHKMFQARHDALEQACNEVVADLRRAETQARCTLQVVQGELNAERHQETQAPGQSFKGFSKVTTFRRDSGCLVCKIHWNVAFLLICVSEELSWASASEYLVP
jgi:hypothetical protein